MTRQVVASMLTSERDSKYLKYRYMERWLILLCLLRSENLKDVQLCVNEYIILSESSYNDGLDAICDISKYGKDLAMQYLELLQKFGRNPFKNSILNREPTPDEANYIFSFQNE